MKLTEITRTNGAVSGALRGLHDAQAGDIIEIGTEGTRSKRVSRIKKVVSKDRLMDQDGNIFNRNGVVYRRVSYPFVGSKGKIISAKLLSQKELDADHEQRKVEFLKSKNWEDVDSETRDKILGMLRVSFTSMQGMREYK